jgi:putative ABC transport system substrate-binding protein
MFDPSFPDAIAEFDQVQSAIRTLRLDPIIREIKRAEDIAPSLETLRGNVDALYVCSGPLITTNARALNTLALEAGLPTMHGLREYVEAGGLMSYGSNFPHMFRRAADFVDKILRGAKPGEIQIEQPTKFDLVVNLKVARELGMMITESFLARADEVIE